MASDNWSAFVDETMPPGEYILVASCLESALIDDVRDAVSGLAPGRRRRFHWRDADDRERRAAVNLVTELPSLHMTAVVTMKSRKHERARRLGLKELLHHLESAGISSVLLDSRRPPQNANDIEAVDAFRAAKVIGSELTVHHARSGGDLQEALLWIPDIVAGAIHGQRRGHNAHLDALEGLITWIYTTAD